MANMDPYWPEHWEMNTYGNNLPTIKGPRGRPAATNSSGVRGGYKEVQAVTQDQADTLLELIDDSLDEQMAAPMTEKYAEDLIDAINRAVDE